MMNEQTNQSLLFKIKQFIRWHDWALDKLPILFLICFYLILKRDDFKEIYIIEFFVFLLFSIVSTIYGYTINNFADLEIDIKQGKVNLFSEISPLGRIVILLSILALAISSGLFFADKPYFLFLWITQFLIATFYSLPPIRLKERGLIGLLIPFFAQLVLPILICFSIFGDIVSFSVIPFLAYGFFKGGAYDIGHQFHDHQHDKKTDTRTFAVEHGGNKVNKIFKTFLILERVFFLLLLFYMTATIRLTFYTYTINPVFLILILYLLVFIMVVIREIKEKHISDPYYVDIRGPANILHIIIPNILLPFYFSFLLFLMDTSYILLGIFFIIWVFPTPSKLLWPIKAIFKSTGL
jgi:4-hydroxybenzoate polyprenyltransferase